MKIFWGIFKIQFKSLLQYKWTFFMSVLAQPIIIYVNYMIFSTIYNYSGDSELQGYGLTQMVWFYTANLIVNSFIWNSVVSDLSYDIRSGELSNILLKPITYFKYSMATALSSRVIAIFMDFLPGIIIYSIILPPSFLSISSFVRFLILMIPTFLLNYMVNFLVGLCAMFIVNSSSLNAISNVLIAFAGGSLIPMEFYPNWLSKFLDYLPYKYIFYYPIQIFLNKSVGEAWHYWFSIVCVQLLWIIVFLILYHFLWKISIRKYCAVG